VCRVALTVSSDQRDKADIKPISKSLEFLKLVKPVQYVKNERMAYVAEDEELPDDECEKKRMYGFCGYDKDAHAAGTKKGGRKRVGVLAQQVQAALMEVYGTDNYADVINDNLHDEKARLRAEGKTLPDGVSEQLTANYAAFVPFLIQAVNELSVELKTLAAELDELKRG
jgi:hypothetical protein